MNFLFISIYRIISYFTHLNQRASLKPNIYPVTTDEKGEEKKTFSSIHDPKIAL